jgi:hypothetical protein
MKTEKKRYSPLRTDYYLTTSKINNQLKVYAFVNKKVAFNFHRFPTLIYLSKSL